MCCIEFKCKLNRPRSSAFRPLNVISPPKDHLEEPCQSNVMLNHNRFHRQQIY